MRRGSRHVHQLVKQRDMTGVCICMWLRTCCDGVPVDVEKLVSTGTTPAGRMIRHGIMIWDVHVHGTVHLARHRITRARATSHVAERGKHAHAVDDASACACVHRHVSRVLFDAPFAAVCATGTAQDDMHRHRHRHKHKHRHRHRHRHAGDQRLSEHVTQQHATAHMCHHATCTATSQRDDTCLGMHV